MGTYRSLIRLVIALLTITSEAPAQECPSKQPIRIIVPLTAGSAIDIVARVVFEQVSKQLGQTVFVENRPGAAQSIGAAAVAIIGGFQL